MTFYRGIQILAYSSPIPDGPKYSWEHPDFDGALDSGDTRYGYAKYLHEAQAQIDAMLEDQED